MWPHTVQDIVEVLHELVWAVLLLLGVLCLWRRSIVEWLTVEAVRETPATLPAVSAVGSGQGHVIF